MRQQKRVLILTEPEDLHALAIDWGISQLGHIAYPWFLPDFPSIQTLTLGLYSAHTTVAINGPDIALNTHAIAAVWKRGLFHPNIPTYLSKSDHLFAKNECINLCTGQNC